MTHFQNCNPKELMGVFFDEIKFCCDLSEYDFAPVIHFCNDNHVKDNRYAEMAVTLAFMVGGKDAMPFYPYLFKGIHDIFAFPHSVSFFAPVVSEWKLFCNLRKIKPDDLLLSKLIIAVQDRNFEVLPDRYLVD